MKFRLSSGPMSWALLSAAFAIFTVCLAPAAQAVTRSVALSGTSSAQTGSFTPSGDGDVTYVDRGPFKPLHLSALQLSAENIRNIRSPERVYPSELHLAATVFEGGRLWVDGYADFLAEPHVGVEAAVKLEQIQLDYFKPITNRYNVGVRNGRLSLGNPLSVVPGRRSWTERHLEP